MLPNLDGWTVEHQDWANPAYQLRRRSLRPSGGWGFLQGEGLHRGHLLGGCLEVLDWLRGSDYWPPKRLGRSDPVSGDVRRCAAAGAGALHVTGHGGDGRSEPPFGDALARPGGDIPPERFSEYDAAILQVVRVEEGLSDLPVVAGMDFGHTDPMFVLPYGVQAEIDCASKASRSSKAASYKLACLASRRRLGQRFKMN